MWLLSTGLHLPFPRTVTWKCFLSLAMASSCARVSLVIHQPSTPEGRHPTSPGSLGNTCQAVQLPADLGNAVPRPDAPHGSPGLPAQAFYKTAWIQAKPEETCHAGPHNYQQGCTCDLLLSQTQNEGKGHRDVQTRSNKEFPSAFTKSLQNIPPFMSPSLPDRNHPSSVCLLPGLGQSIS